LSLSSCRASRARRVERVEPCCSTISTQPKCMGSTRSTCRASRARRVERVEPCCSTISTQPKCMGSTRRTCRVVSSQDVTNQVEFGLQAYTGWFQNLEHLITSSNINQFSNFFLCQNQKSSC